MINFTDTVIMDKAKARRTADGYLVAEVRAARTGIQVYNRSELGLSGSGTINVYRPEEEVFNKDSLASYVAKPVTIGHPSVPVTAENWHDYGVGSVGNEVMRDGEFVRVPLIMMDSKAIKSAETTHKQISMGYSAEIVMQDGKAPDGTPYEAVQKNIRINHLAAVPAGRAGPEVGFSDEATWGVSPLYDHKPSTEGGRPMSDNLQKVVFDGITIEATTQAVQAIEKLQNQLKDAAKAQAVADASHAQAIADAQAELARKDAEIDALKAKVVDDAALDARVAARSELIAVAAALVSDFKSAGLSDAAIKRAVVENKRGKEAMAGKPDAYIDAAFDIIAEDAKAAVVQGDKLALALGSAKPINTNDAKSAEDTAYQASLARFDRKKAS